MESAGFLARYVIEKVETENDERGKYRTYKNVEDGVNRQFVIVLYSTGVQCCLMIFLVNVQCTI